MRRILLVLTALVGMLMLSAALAQTITDPITYITGLAGALLGGVAALGGWSAAVTGWLRHHWLKKLDGVAVTGVAFIIAFLTAGGLVLATPATLSIFVIVALALAASIFASGTLAVTFKGPIKGVIDVVYGMLLNYLKGKGIDTSNADSTGGGSAGEAQPAAAQEPAPSPG